MASNVGKHKDVGKTARHSERREAHVPKHAGPQTGDGRTPKPGRKPDKVVFKPGNGK